MEIKILKNEKNEIEVGFDDLTFPEILRVYLNNQTGVTFAAWKKEHSTKDPVLVVRTKGKDAKAVMDGAVKAVISDLEKIEADFKKLK